MLEVPPLQIFLSLQNIQSVILPISIINIIKYMLHIHYMLQIELILLLLLFFRLKIIEHYFQYKLYFMGF